MKNIKKSCKEMWEKHGETVKKGIKILAIGFGVYSVARISYEVGIGTAADKVNELMAKGFLDATLPSGEKPATMHEWYEKVIK